MIGGAVVIDMTNKSGASDNSKKYGHVGIVTSGSADGKTFTYMDSNGKAGTQKISMNNKGTVSGNTYFTKAQGKSSPTATGATG